MFCSLPRSGTYRSKTYCMEKAFDFLKANKAVAFATVEGGKPKIRVFEVIKVHIKSV